MPEIAFRIRINFEEQPLRILQRLIVRLGQRVIVTAQCVNRSDQIKRRRRIHHSPDAGGGSICCVAQGRSSQREALHK